MSASIDSAGCQPWQVAEKLRSYFDQLSTNGEKAQVSVRPELVEGQIGDFFSNLLDTPLVKSLQNHQTRKL